MDKCKICGGFIYTYSAHKCPDKFEVCFTQWGEEWQEVYADSYEEAVEKAAEQDDSYGDYSIVKQGRTDNVLVRKCNSGEETKHYEVIAEMQANYYAEEKL